MATYRRSYLFRLACDPPLHLWTGFGPLVTGPDQFDPSGATWKGAAEILSIPDVKLLINGIAERLDFGVSGVSPEAIRLALDDRDSVDGAQALLGYVEFDDRWQLTGPIVWEWMGVAGVIITESGANDGGRTRSITLSIASSDTLRSNPQPAYFTANDQRKRSIDDQFCSHVAGISLGSTRRFGPK